MSVVNFNRGQGPGDQPRGNVIRLSLADTKLLDSLKKARTLYPFADVSAEESLCFLEDLFGADAGDRVVYNGPLLPRWLAHFDV